jgi:hypothetical protein
VLFPVYSEFRRFCRATTLHKFQSSNNSATQPETILSLNIMSALSLFLSQLFEENGTERVHIQVDNVKQTHSSFQRQTSSLEAVLSRSDGARDRWSGMTKRIPSELFSLSPTLTRHQKSHNTERAGSVDSLLSLPRRKTSPRSIRRNLDQYFPPSISEGGHNAQWNVKGGTVRREAAELLFFDHCRLDKKETKTTRIKTKTTTMAISAD